MCTQWTMLSRGAILSEGSPSLSVHVCLLVCSKQQFAPPQPASARTDLDFVCVYLLKALNQVQMAIDELHMLYYCFCDVYKITVKTDFKIFVKEGRKLFKWIITKYLLFQRRTTITSNLFKNQAISHCAKVSFFKKMTVQYFCEVFFAWNRKLKSNRRDAAVTHPAHIGFI